MAKTPQLSDLQLILLSHASRHADGSLLPFPDNMANDRDRIAAALAPLLKRQLIAEAAAAARTQIWRDDDEQPVGLFITAAGRARIGVTDDSAAGEGGSDQSRSGAHASEDDAGAGAGGCDDVAGADGDAGGGDTTTEPDHETPPGASAAARTGSKTEAVLELLRRGEGATLAELVAATGWLPHTTRAALTGLRKKGHAIARGTRGDATCYRIAGA